MTEPLIPTNEEEQPSDDDRDLIDRAFSVASQEFGVPEPILRAIADVESGGNPKAVGPPTKYGRARGMMQIIPPTAKALGINPDDPVEAIVGAAALLGDEYDYFRKKGHSEVDAWEKAIAAYFAGRRAAERGLNSKDAVGTSVNQYVDRVAARAYSIAQRTPQPSLGADQQGPTAEEVGAGVAQAAKETAPTTDQQLTKPVSSAERSVQESLEPVQQPASQPTNQPPAQQPAGSLAPTTNQPAVESAQANEQAADQQQRPDEQRPVSFNEQVVLTAPLAAESPSFEFGFQKPAVEMGGEPPAFSSVAPDDEEEVVRVETRVKRQAPTKGEQASAGSEDNVPKGWDDHTERIRTRANPAELNFDRALEAQKAYELGKRGAQVRVKGRIYPGDNKRTIVSALVDKYGLPESVVEQKLSKYIGSDYSLFATDPQTSKELVFKTPEAAREYYPYTPSEELEFTIPVELALDLAGEGMRLWEAGSTGLVEADVARELFGWDKQETLRNYGTAVQFAAEVARPVLVAASPYSERARKALQIKNEDIAEFFDITTSADLQNPQNLSNYQSHYEARRPYISAASGLVSGFAYGGLGAALGPVGAIATPSLALSLSNASQAPDGTLIDADTGEPITPAQIVGRTAANAGMFALAGGLARAGGKLVTRAVGPASQSVLGKVGQFVGNAAVDAVSGTVAGIGVEGVVEAGKGILDDRPAAEIAQNVGRAISGQTNAPALYSQIGGAIGFQILNRLLHGKPGQLVTPAFEDSATGQKFAIGVDQQGRPAIQDLPANHKGPTITLSSSDWLELKTTNYNDPSNMLRVVKAATAQGGANAFREYLAQAQKIGAEINPEFKAASLNPDMQALAEAYAKSRGMEIPPAEKYVPIDAAKEAVLGEAADFYAATPHTPNDEGMRSSYQVFAKETLDQYKAIVDWVTAQTGRPLEIMAWTGEGEPYANSRQMIDDMVKNGRYFYLPTDTAGAFAADHPMLQRTGLKDSEGRPLILNDVFRIVHDVFGHGQYSNQFGPNGEMNAWRYHSRLYSPDAQKALLNETLLQNAATNFNESIRSLPPDKRPPLTERPFVDQKVVPVPDELLTKLKTTLEEGGVAVLPVQYERNKILDRLKQRGYVDVGELASRNEVLAAGRVAAELGIPISPTGRISLDRAPADAQPAEAAKGAATATGPAERAGETRPSVNGLAAALEAAAARDGQFKIRLNGGSRTVWVRPFERDPLNYAIDESGTIYSLDVHPPAVDQPVEQVDHRFYSHIPALYNRNLQYGRVVDFGESGKVAVASDDVFETLTKNTKAVGANVSAESLYSAPISPQLKKAIIESAGPDGRVVLVKGSEPASSVFLQTIPHEFVHSALSGVSDKAVAEAIRGVDQSALTEFGKGLLTNPRVAFNEMLAYVASGEWSKIWTSREAAKEAVLSIVSRLEAVEGERAKQTISRIRSVSRHAEEFVGPREGRENQTRATSARSDSADAGRGDGAAERGSGTSARPPSERVRGEPDSAIRDTDQRPAERVGGDSEVLFREAPSRETEGAELRVSVGPDGKRRGKLSLFPRSLREYYRGLLDPSHYGEHEVYVPGWFTGNEPHAVALEGEGWASIIELPMSRELYEKLKSELAGTYFTADDSGTPIVFYHGTLANFSRFRPSRTSDFGFHAGTKKAAEDRVQLKLDQLEEGWSSARFQYIPLVVKARNPLIVRDDLGGKTDVFVDNILGRPEVFSNLSTELYEAAKAEIFGRGFRNGGERLLAEMKGEVPKLDFARLLLKHGYDSVLYRNNVEDPGSYSIIFLQSRQVKHAYNGRRYDFGSADIYYREPAEVYKPNLVKVVMGGPTHFIVEETTTGANARSVDADTIKKEIVVDYEPKTELEVLNAALKSLGAGAIITETGTINHPSLVRGIETLRTALKGESLRIKTPSKTYLFVPSRDVAPMVNPQVGAVVYDGGNAFGKGAVPVVVDSGPPVFVGSKFSKSALTSKLDLRVKEKLEALFDETERRRYNLKPLSGNAYSLKGSPAEAIGGVGRGSVRVEAVAEIYADTSKFQGALKSSLAGRDTTLAVWGIGSTEFAYMPEATGKDGMPVVEVVLTEDGKIVPISGGPNIAALSARRGAVPLRVFIEELSPQTKSLIKELENKSATDYFADPESRRRIREEQLDSTGKLKSFATILPAEYYSLPITRWDGELPRVVVGPVGAELKLPEGYKPSGPIKAEVVYSKELDLSKPLQLDFFSAVGEASSDPITNLKDFIERGTFSLVSGFHNKSNKDFTDRIEYALNSAGFKTVRVKGRYAGTEEPSLIVLHENIPNAEERIDIAALHAGQQATIHVRGGVATMRDFGRDIEVHKPIAEMVEYTAPESEIVRGDTSADGTFLPTGEGFIFNFDFDTGSTTIPLNKEFGVWVRERLSRGPFYPEREELSVVDAVPGITVPPARVVYEGKGAKEIEAIDDIRTLKSSKRRKENLTARITSLDGKTLELPIGRVLVVGDEEMRLWAAPFRDVVWGTTKPNKQNQLAIKINEEGKLEGKIVEKKREGKKNKVREVGLVQLGATPDGRVLLADKETGVPLFEVGLDEGKLVDVWRLSQRPSISTVTRALAETTNKAGLNPRFRRVPQMGTLEYNRAVDILTHGFANIALRGLSALHKAGRLEGLLGVKISDADWLPRYEGEPSGKCITTLVDALGWYIKDVKRAMPFIKRLAEVGDGDELMAAALNQVARLSLANTSAGEDVASNLRLAVEAVRRAFGVGVDLASEQEQFLRDLPLLMNGYVPKSNRIAAEPGAHQLVVEGRVYVRSESLSKEIADWGPVVGTHRWLSSRPQVGTTNSEVLYGKKVGQFNLSLFDNVLTAAADRWVARISRLLLGLHDLAIGDPDGGKMTDRERALYVRAMNNAATTLNLMLEARGLPAVFDAKTMQAFLWYFTKNVFGEFGVPQQYNSTYSRAAIEELFNALSEQGKKLDTATRAEIRREAERLAESFDSTFGDVAPLNFIPVDLPLYRERVDSAEERIPDQYGDPLYWAGLVARLKGGTIDPELFKAIETMAAQGNVEGLKQLVKNQLPSVLDLVVGRVFRAARLAGVGVQVRNAVSNTINTTATTTSLYGAALLDVVYSRLFHTPPTLYALNPREFAAAVSSSAKELWPTVKKVWKGQADATKFAFEAQMTTAGEMPEWLGVRGKVTHYIDSLANVVFKAQSVADLPYRLFVHQLTRRMIAKAKAIDLDIPEAEAFAWLTPADEEAALNIAAQAVFQAETGTLARGFILLTEELNKSPFLRPMLSMVVPYPKTPANVAQQSVDFSPLGLSASVSKALTSSGRKVLATDSQARLDFLLGVSKGTLGTALWVLGYYLAKHGYLTPTLSWTDKDEDERRRQRYLGLQDGALVVDGATYKIDGIGPAGAALIAGATAFSSDSPAEFTDRMGALMLTAYPQGKAAKSVSEGRLSDQLTNIGIVPAALAEAARATDPYERDLKADSVWERVKNRLKAQIPGLRESLPPKPDSAGKPIKASPLSSFGPFRKAELPPDYEARRRLIELGASPPTVSLPNEEVVLKLVLPFAPAAKENDMRELVSYARKLIKIYADRSNLTDEEKEDLLRYNLRVMRAKQLLREVEGLEADEKRRAADELINKYFTSNPKKMRANLPQVEELEQVLDEMLNDSKKQQ